ncbi:MAG TPA: AbrB family transcriptional regulator [Patescibacteria group bacterium]|nr:AbrB family transcriptional regulator [Patescibacteria group bacterium]
MIDACKPGKLPLAGQWGVLLGLSAGFYLFLAWIGVPAALLLGAILAAVVLTVSGGTLRIPPRAYILAQGLIGGMIAKMLPSMVGGILFDNWPILILGGLSVIAASGFLGWLAIRLRILPGTTVLWGLSPGAATAMTVMAEAHGADVQLVAFMQYLRVAIVAAVASLVARLFGASLHHAATSVTWFPVLDGLSFCETLALVLSGPLLASRLGLRGGALLIPLVLGLVLTSQGWIAITLPPWLLAIAYALIGWRIGLLFTRPLLAHAARALPSILACTLALIALCGGLAAVLVAVAGVDPLTAYLATSPGGADTVAMITASSHVDTHFVMAMQMVRLVAVLLLGPPLARFIALKSKPKTNF